jgi:hypothetical protein
VILKNKALKIVNAVLAALVVNQIASALLFGKGIITYPVFEWMHKRGVWVLMAMMFAHLILNWNWIKINYFGKKG